MASVARAHGTDRDDVASLRAALKDVQAKRIMALRSYQEEKNGRERAVAAAAASAERYEREAAARALLQKRLDDVGTGLDDRACVVRSEFFVAELTALGLGCGGPSASLTWHCLAMEEALRVEPRRVQVCVPGDGLMGARARKGDLDERKEPLSANGAPSKRSSHDQTLIANLKEQLDASRAALDELLETVKEQEDTIQSLAHATSAAS